MAAKMTRKRALSLAMDAINFEMVNYLTDAQMVANGNTSPYIIKRNEHYAELAAALRVIEHMSRQGEMHL